ncbi:MAG: ABC transporter transmembrane domain-containing protein, partial [Nitrospinota bacterium]
MQLYLRLLGYLKPYWRRFALAVVCTAALGGLAVVPPYIAKNVVDDLLISRDMWMLKVLPLVILLTYAVKGLFSYVQTYFMSWIGQRVVMDVRNDLYGHLHSLPLSFFVRRTTGELMSKVTYDITLMQKSAASGLRDLGQYALTFVFLLVLAFYRDPVLSAVFVVVLPPLGLLVVHLGGKIRRITRRTETQMGDINSAMKEAFQAIRIVKAHSAEEHEVRRFARRNRRFFDLIMKALRVRAISHPLVEVLGGVGAAFVLWYGGYQVVAGLKTPGEFTSFLAAIGLIFSPIKRLTR